MSEEKDPKSPKDPKDHKPAEGELAAIPASLVFRTRDIIRPDLLRGKNYRLAEYAPLVDFNFRFEIETPWGTIPAQGLAMLDLRLRELCALEYGSRIAEKNPQYTAGFAQGVCNTAQGAYIFVTDPVGSVRRTGEVLQRWALTKKSPGGCKANCEARRRIACLIGCDPETHNEPLECLLDDMTINATGGWLTVSVGLNFGLPGLGFVPFNTEFKKIMEHRSTLEIQADLDAALIELGIPEASRTRFFACLNYTTTERMAFVFYLRKLIGIENIASLVDGAADTHNESEAMAAIRELQLIADLRHTRDFSRVTFIGVPVLTLDDGTQIIVTVADYLVETPRTAQMIAGYRKTFAEVPTKLATFGRVSIGAQKQFKDADIEVIRHKLGPDSPLAGSKKETPRDGIDATPCPAPPDQRSGDRRIDVAVRPLLLLPHPVALSRRFARSEVAAKPRRALGGILTARLDDAACAVLASLRPGPGPAWSKAPARTRAKIPPPAGSPSESETVSPAVALHVAIHILTLPTSDGLKEGDFRNAGRAQTSRAP